MAHSWSASQSFLKIARSTTRTQSSDPLLQCLVPRLRRTYATQVEAPDETTQQAATTLSGTNTTAERPSVGAPRAPAASPFLTPVIATTYSWPEMRPHGLQQYTYQHLNLPLRKDILHRAVIFEADGARQGTASTRYRTQVKGSGRKKRPQKGTGQSRQSDFKSPAVRGGGVAHGPHARDFSTDLPGKVYNLAYLTALSYRYRKGELILLEQSASLPDTKTARWLDNFFRSHRWGEGNGRTLVVLATHKAETLPRQRHLIEALGQVGEHAEVRSDIQVSVKDLLSCGRVLMERGALQNILRRKSDVRVRTEIEV